MKNINSGFSKFMHLQSKIVDCCINRTKYDTKNSSASSSSSNNNNGNDSSDSSI